MNCRLDSEHRLMCSYLLIQENPVAYFSENFFWFPACVWSMGWPGVIPWHLQCDAKGWCGSGFFLICWSDFNAPLVRYPRPEQARASLLLSSYCRQSLHLISCEPVELIWIEIDFLWNLDKFKTRKQNFQRVFSQENILPKHNYVPISNKLITPNNEALPWDMHLSMDFYLSVSRLPMIILHIYIFGV